MMGSEHTIKDLTLNRRHGLQSDTDNTDAPSIGVLKRLLAALSVHVKLYKDANSDLQS